MKHSFVARLKADHPFLASVGSRAYSIARAIPNKKVVRTAKRVSFSGTIVDAVTGEMVAHDRVLDLLDKGHVLIARDLVDNTGLTADFDKVFHDAYNVHYADLGRIHELLDVETILEVTEKLHVDPAILRLECSVFWSLFPGAKNFYAELMPNLRPAVPYRLVRGKEKEIEERVGRGKMNAHGPHKDSWRFHPNNTINVWLALSDVSGLNGMFLLPHSLGYCPKFGDNEIVPGCDTYPERQWLTEMKQGDALLFRAELMHGSIMNQTESTRFAFSMRGSVEPPEFHKDFMYNYVRISPSFSNLTRLKATAHSDFAPPSRDEHFAEWGPQPRPLRDISRVEGDVLVVSTPEGEKRFCARCPHQGVPLKDGRLENGRIVCAQHQFRVEPLAD